MADSPFLGVYIIGGGGGVACSFSSDGDAVLEKIGVWLSGRQIKAMKIWLSNGQSRQFGNPSGPYKECSFQPGETITEMSLWGNGNGTRLGAIAFKTKNQEFLAKMTKWPLKQRYPIDVGSGICVGVEGRSGADIDAMGFKFIKPISKAVMMDMEYPTIATEKPNVAITEFETVQYNNPADKEAMYTYTKSHEVTTKQKWEVTAAIEFTYHASVKAGIPHVVESEAGWSLKASTSVTHETETTMTEKKEWSFPVTIPPHTRRSAVLKLGQADIDIPYNAAVEVTTTDGSILKFPVHGIYKGVTFSNVIFSVSDQ